MKEISSAEAFRDLNAWNKESRVGCIYTVRDVESAFSIRRAKLEIRETDLFIETETGKGLMHLRDCTFERTDPGDLPFQLKRGFPPLAVHAIRTRFRNGDVCFFFLD